MVIIIRKTQGYMDVIVKDGQVTLDLGFHDVKERKTLAQTLIDAASELLEGLDDDEVDESNLKNI